MDRYGERQGDSYRPESMSRRGNDGFDRPLPRYDDRPPPPPPDGDMFHFRGAASRPRDNHGGDSYRPGGFSQGGGESYRPSGNDRRDNGRSFDFNFQGGSAPSFAPSTDYPSARRGPKPQQSGRGRSQNARGSRGGRGRGRGGWVPKRAGDRELLRTEREPTPEQLQGMNVGQSRFKDFDEVSVSGSEAAMDLAGSSDDDETESRNAFMPIDPIEDSESEDEHPRAKRARVRSPELAAQENKPKWSNPDPYTVLPPPDETQTRKNKDVVKLIRKAKVEAAKPDSATNAASDFISLNFDDEASDNKSGSESGELSQSDDDENSKQTSTLRRSFSHLDNLHPDRIGAPAVAEKGINMALPAGRLDVWPPPPPGSNAAARGAYDAAVDKQDSTDLTANARQANTQRGKKRKHPTQELGEITEEWSTPSDADPTPWLNLEDQTWPTLHKEILDFYDYVKPRDYEEEVRNNLVHRIQRAVQSKFQDVQVKTFGSFASGLYLPTADMDLVAVSSQFLERGYGRLGTNSQMRKFAGCLESAKIVKPGSLTVITGARVPIIKLVDSQTGLRVDVSFENNSGLIAQRTFEDWKRDYPAMPIIVSLIKQFLVMRGMSEVFSGGLGGYSVICLVVSIVRRLQKEKGAEWDQRDHLDHILMEFFIHYGEEFDLESTGIQMEPWGYVSKTHWRPQRAKPSQADRLLIIDPNKYDNDISGGSKNVGAIFNAFRRAYNTLNDGLDEVEETFERQGEKISILERVWGGNYGLFEIQRARLKALSGGQSRPAGFQPGNKAISRSTAPQADIVRTEMKRSAPASKSEQSNKRQKTANSMGTKESPINLDESSEDNAHYLTSSRANGDGKKNPESSASFQPINKPNAHNGSKPKAAGFDQMVNETNDKSDAPKTKPPKKEKKTKKMKKEEAAASVNIKSQKEKASKKASEASRAKAFQKAHPGVVCPNRLSREEFKNLTKKHGVGVAL